MFRKYFLLTILLVTGFLLAGCNGQETSSEGADLDVRGVSSSIPNDGFLGDKGIKVEDTEGKIFIEESVVSDGNYHAFNYYSQKLKKNVYFFTIKASDGTYRAAANACEVCYGSKKGFSQVGNLIRCDNCQVTYPKDKIAIEKGGCNPGPINRDVPVVDGKLEIDVSDVEAVAYLF